MTGYIDSVIQTKCYESGIVGVYNKPMTLDKMQAIMEEVDEVGEM